MKGSEALFTEAEAAERLGLPVEQFRVLARDHLGGGETLPQATQFRPSELIALRILAGGTQKITVG